MTEPSLRKRLSLGVDAGGTKSDAVLIDETGAVIGWGRGGSAHSLYVGTQAALESYAEAVKSALGDHHPNELWVAGPWYRALDALDIGLPEVRFVQARELTMGLAMALETCGVLVLSGTGSFVGGLTESGQTLTLDGLGPVLGDHGSGYQIGLMGIRAAMASCWSPRRRTVLEQIIPRELGVRTLEGVFDLVYTQHIGRSRIASAARAVARAAEDGDEIARNIILHAADDISEVLADVIGRLGIEDSDLALVASGGVAQGSALYWDRVCERALEIAPRLRPIRPKVRPCVGAALLALKAMGIAWSHDLLARIEETQTPFLPDVEEDS